MKTIASAFVKAQQQFEKALKTSNNPHFRSKYADLGTCIDAVLSALHENGIGLTQRLYEDATGVTVETVLLHESGEVLEGGKLHVPASKQDPQGYGSALTYARRYSVMAMCGIAPEDDDGNAATRPKAQNDSRFEDFDLKIKESSNLEELRDTFSKAIAAARQACDKEAEDRFIKTKDTRKAQLEAA